jgi:hypothetical protein
MLVAVTPGSVEGHGVAIFGGRFDPTSLGAALVKRGAAATSVAGVSAYKLTERSEHQGQAPYLVAREDTVIVGDESSMTEVLAEASSGNLLVQREVDAGRVDLRAPFWMVAALPPEMREHLATRTPAAGEGGDPAAQAVVTAARTIRRVTMQATLGESLEIKGLAEADTAENAELLRDAVKGALAAVRLQTQDQYPELVEVLRDVKITLDGTEVQGSGAIPVALIEKLAQHRHGECRHVI